MTIVKGVLALRLMFSDLPKSFHETLRNMSPNNTILSVTLSWDEHSSLPTLLYRPGCHEGIHLK